MRFLAFQIILYYEDFSEYIKNLFKLQESDNHVVKYILSIMNILKLYSWILAVFELKIGIIFPH